MSATAPDTNRNAELLPPDVAFVSPRRLGLLVNRSPAWVYSRISDGRLRAVTVDGALRVRRADALAWLAAIVREHDPARPDVSAA